MTRHDHEAEESLRALRIPTRREIRDVARLAAPIVMVQVGMMLMGVVDTAIVGHVSEIGLAGVALGNLFWFVVTTLGQGTIMALDPIVAQAVGARDDVAVARGLQRGLLLATAIAILSGIALVPAESFFTLARQPAEVRPLAAEYAQICIVGQLPFFVFVVLRQSMQAFSRVRPILVAVVIANVVNALLDWVLVFGRLGAPQLGPIGSAYATVGSRWVMCVVLAWAGRDVFRTYLRPWRPDAFNLTAFRRMLLLGVPIGIHQWIEAVAFSLGLILVGLMGTTAVAAHQITITLAALTYMVPLGVAAAAAVLVGHAIGRGEPDAARREAGAALACGVGFMCLTAVILIVLPSALAHSFTSDPKVIAIALTLIPLAGVFQVFDGIQGVSSGILRGAGDTHVPALLNLTGYAVGLPVGGWLAFSRGMGPAGIWWGLVVGLAAVGAALGWRVHYRLGRELERIDVDAPRPVPRYRAPSEALDIPTVDGASG